MELGAWIRRNREALEMSQQALAVELGTDSGSVSRWERSVGSPSVDKLEHLCRVFKATPHESLKAMEAAAKVKRKRRSAA